MNYLLFWAYAVNDHEAGFQGKQPLVVLRTSGGSYSYEPQQSYEPQPSVMYNRAWHLYHVPLAGDANWTRTESGSPTLADVNAVEIHQDTWDFGFTLFYDGLRFAHLSPGGLPPPGPSPPPGVNPDAGQSQGSPLRLRPDHAETRAGNGCTPPMGGGSP